VSLQPRQPLAAGQNSEVMQRFILFFLLGHALHVCATGAVASCAARPVCVGPNSIWPGSLGRQATWERCFESSRRSPIPAAAGGGGGGGAMRGLTDFDPPFR
jgi:hypothetical protein